MEMEDAGFKYTRAGSGFIGIERGRLSPLLRLNRPGKPGAVHVGSPLALPALVLPSCAVRVGSRSSGLVRYRLLACPRRLRCSVWIARIRRPTSWANSWKGSIFGRGFGIRSSRNRMKTDGQMDDPKAGWMPFRKWVKSDEKMDAAIDVSTLKTLWGRRYPPCRTQDCRTHRAVVVDP